MAVFAVANHASANEASAIVVIFNSADPSSEALARYYANKRKIDGQQLVGLRCPDSEEISRSEYQNDIALPLREIFLAKGWWRAQGGRIVESKVRYVALIRGIPLKIRSREAGAASLPGRQAVAMRDEASLDSELAVLATNDRSDAGVAPNPYYGSFIPVLELMTEPGLLLVCRLDAPSEETVKSMIDSALAAERNGLWGWAYVDSRNIQSGAYAKGDEWLKKLSSEMRGEGIPVLLEKAPQVLPSGFPVSDAAVYYGWYAESISGSFAEEGFRFKPGAIAAHIHSFSASTLRDPVAGWCGPLLERGASATLGTVYEPYLMLTTHLDKFQSRLMKGFTFAESAYMSTPALSWMNVAVGDPLYRPYAVWRKQPMRTDKPTIWKQYRDIIQAANGDILSAESQLQRAAEGAASSMFLESLAAAQSDTGAMSSAISTLDKAIAIEPERVIRFRLGLERAGILDAIDGESSAAGSMNSQTDESLDKVRAQLLETLSQRSPAATAPRK